MKLLPGDLMGSEILLILLLGGMRAQASSCEDRDRFFSLSCLKEKKKRPKQPIQAFFLCSTGFSCLSLASFFPRIPTHLKHRSVCSASLLSFALELVDSLELWFIRDQLSKTRNVRLLSLDGIWAVCLNPCFCLEMLRTIAAMCAQWPRSGGTSKQGSVSSGRYAGNSVGLHPSGFQALVKAQ